MIKKKHFKAISSESINYMYLDLIFCSTRLVQKYHS